MEASPPNEVIQPDGWTRPSGYAHGVRVSVDKELLFVAGQVGWDASGRFPGPDLVAQFEQALRNCLSVVDAAGGGASDVVRLTVFCTSVAEYRRRREELGEAWRRVMGRSYPAMSLVQVPALVEQAAVVEVEATAALPARGGH